MRDERFAVGEHPHLEIDLTSGSVVVEAGDAGVVVIGIDSSQADSTEIVQLGDNVSVRSSGGWLSRSGHARVVASVPPGTNLSVKAGSAHVVVRGHIGAVRVRTSSGDIELERADRVDVSSSSGKIRLGQVVDATVASSSGNITIDTTHGRLEATSSSGDLRADSVAGNLHVGTVSGDVRVRRCDGDEIAIKTVSGDVQVGLPSGIRVDPEVSTLSGKTYLPAPTTGASKGAPSTDRRHVRLHVRTVSGDVRIERAS